MLFRSFSVTSPVAALPGLMPNASFNMERDFAPLIRVGTGYNILAVNPAVPAQSVSELIAFLKKDPGKHTFSSGGFGTPAHLIGELFKLETGVQTTHVPYVQFPQAIGDLVSGVNTYQFITALPVLQLIKTGKLRALAVTTAKRSPVLPDLPTVAESGVPSYSVDGWYAVVMPAKTPPAIVEIGRAHV